MTHHIFPFRIYYEDTDAGGVVYHGNYLNFSERARTEFLRDIGFESRKLQDDQNMMFVVRHAEVDYLKPAFLDDGLSLETSILKLKNSSFVLKQDVFREKELICAMKVTLVCVEKNTVKPVRLPDGIRAGFQDYLEEET